ncbi:MAG: hypothetical protein ACRCX2_27740 [Paraclostridium sp.]
MAGTGTRALATEYNSIQDWINNVTNLWGNKGTGSHRVAAGQVITAAVYNQWMHWLRLQNNAIAGGGYGVPGNVGVGTKITWTQLQGAYNAGSAIANHCNRSECNKSENNKSENNRSENNSSECNYLAERDSGERNTGGERNYGGEGDW